MSAETKDYPGFPKTTELLDERLINYPEFSAIPRSLLLLGGEVKYGREESPIIEMKNGNHFHLVRLGDGFFHVDTTAHDRYALD